MNYDEKCQNRVRKLYENAQWENSYKSDYVTVDCE